MGVHTMFDIGKRLIELRNQQDISANKLSKLLSVDPSTLNKIEKGTAKPSIDLLFRICGYFSITLSDFFNDGSNAVALPDDVKELVEAVKELDGKQIKKLTEFIKVMK